MSFIQLFAVLIGSLSVCVSSLVHAEMSASHHDAHSTSESTPIEQSDSVTYRYVCPMHPQIIRDHEGVCPICGMDLVKQAFEASDSAPKIRIHSSKSTGEQAALTSQWSVRLQTAQKTTLWKYIPTYGRIVADESKVIHIHPRASGWLSHLSVRDNGEKVQKGQLLYRLYSPEVVSAQQDYLLALQNQTRLGQRQNSIVRAAETRLRLLGLNGATIKRIARSGAPINEVPFYAPQSGYVGNLIVQNGMYIQPQTELMSLTDFSTVWVEAEVLPLQQAWIQKDLSVDVQSKAYPEQRWEGQVDYIYPTADAQTQAMKVRIALPNQAELLKPNMFVDVAIYGGPKSSVLAIPLSAVIDDGQVKRVVKETEEGDFQIAEIVTGMQTKGLVEVLSGLQDGDRVVVSGQFLLDSESQIQSNLRRFSSPAASSHHAH